MESRALLGIIFAIFAANASAQVTYKCNVKGKVEYSGTPCMGGKTIQIITNPVPLSDEDQNRAIDRVQRDIDGVRSREAAEHEAAQSSGGRRVVDMTDHANEPVLVKDKNGNSFYKPRGQVEAEAAAKEAGRARAQGIATTAPSAPTNNEDAWRRERTLTNDSRQSSYQTRQQAVDAEGVQEEMRERARMARPRTSAPDIAQPRTDQYGHTYTGEGSTVIRNDGKVCHVMGPNILCN